MKAKITVEFDRHDAFLVVAEIMQAFKEDRLEKHKDHTILSLCSELLDIIEFRFKPNIVAEFKKKKAVI